MTKHEFILVVDIGTGAAKAIAFDHDLRLVSIARKHYPILTPRRGWSEQDPEVIWKAVAESLHQLIESLPQKAYIQGISFSSQMYNVLAVDIQGNAITNSMTWADTRAAEIVKEIRPLPEIHDIFRNTGDPIDAIFPLYKILWMQRNLELPRDVRFISIKDYVIHKFLNRYLADWSTASASGMFDIKSQCWDENALALLNITPAQLSEPVSPRKVYHGINREIAQQIGLPFEMPLIMGGGDGPLASLGVGAWDERILAVNVGSSAAARLITPSPWIDPNEKLYTQIADQDHWVVGGIVSSGGIVYEWFLNSFLDKNIAGQIHKQQDNNHVYSEQEVAQIPASADGVIFIPYLAGEQCPGWRPETRGAFWGLDFHHTHGHMVRAVLEGITYSIYRVIKQIQAGYAAPFEEVRVSGGLTSSTIWLQMAANIFGYPIIVSETMEGSAKGAAALAWIALGIHSDYTDFSSVLKGKQKILPNSEIHFRYQRWYENFLNLLQYS